MWQKPTNLPVHPVKTQTSLGISLVSSESLLCTQWVAKRPSFHHAPSEDSDQTGRMPRPIWVFAGRTSQFVSFVMMRLKCYSTMNSSTLIPQICSERKFKNGTSICCNSLQVKKTPIYWNNPMFFGQTCCYILRKSSQCTVMVLHFWTKSVDQAQTERAVWSWSILFA